MILVDANTNQQVTPNFSYPSSVTNIDTALSKYLLNTKKQAANSRVLKEVVIKSTAIPVKKPNHQDYVSLMGLSNITDEDIPGTVLNACPNMLECLKSVSGTVTFDTNNFFIRRGHNIGDTNQPPVALYVNGTQVDINYLATVNPADVESIEVFRSDGLSGINKMSGTNGVVVINLKKVVQVKMSNAQKMAILNDLQSSSVEVHPKGYNMARAFYSPKYDAGRGPIGDDLRTTIYWNPKVVTDKTGNATFDFFNADNKGTYRLIIEGIDADGNIGRTVYRYKIQ